MSLELDTHDKKPTPNPLMMRPLRGREPKGHDRSDTQAVRAAGQRHLQDHDLKGGRKRLDGASDGEDDCAPEEGPAAPEQVAHAPGCQRCHCSVGCGMGTGVSAASAGAATGGTTARTERANLEDGNHCPELVARRVVEGGLEVGLSWPSGMPGHFSTGEPRRKRGRQAGMQAGE